MPLEFVKLTKGSSAVSQVGSLGFFKLGVESGGGDIEFSRTFSENSPAVISAVSAQISANNMTSAQVEETYGWKIGNTTSIPLSSGETIKVRIIGFNHDNKGDGSGKAGITLEMSIVMNALTYIHTSGVKYVETYVYKTYLPKVKSKMPEEWQTAIKYVNKSYATGWSASSVETSSMDLFLLSCDEVMAPSTASWVSKVTRAFGNEGSLYEYYTNSSASRRVKYQGTNAQGWWLRSCAGDTANAWSFIQSSGSPWTNATSTSTKYGVSFAFCI